MLRRDGQIPLGLAMTHERPRTDTPSEQRTRFGGLRGRPSAGALEPRPGGVGASVGPYKESHQLVYTIPRRLDLTSMNR